jgi:hypothetical protein
LARPALKGLDFADKFTHVIKLSVNRYVANIGDRIDVVEFVHDFGPDTGGRNFVVMISMQLAKNFINRSTNYVHRDFALLAGFDESTEKFLPVNGFAGPIPLNDAEFGALDLLVCCEAGSAIQALTSSPNRGSVL